MAKRGRSEPAFLKDDFEQASGGAARRVLLETMMHLDQLGVIIGVKNVRRLSRQMEQQVDAD